MPNTEATEIVIVRLADGEQSQFAIGALPRPGRLPFKEVRVHATHLSVVGQDGIQEELGSPDEPLDAGVLEQLHSSEGLIFAELDEDTGAPLTIDRMKG